MIVKSITRTHQYRVYRNLHNGKWSIRCESTGLVVGHADRVELAAVSCLVSKAGQQRVVKEGRKNVHAFLRGYVVAVEGFEPYCFRTLYLTTASDWEKDLEAKCGLALSYNPYKGPTFFDKDTQKPLGWVFAAVLEKGVRYAHKPLHHYSKAA